MALARVAASANNQNWNSSGKRGKSN